MSDSRSGARTAMLRERLAAAIASQPMFRGLAPEDQAKVAELAFLRDYERGDVAWNEGDPPDLFTLVVRGRIKVVRHADAGDVILEIFGVGEPVGAIAVYNAMPYPASAVCLEPTTLFCLPRQDYFDLLDRHPGFGRSIIRELTRLTLALTRKLQESRGQRVETRIAHLFLTLAERMGRPTSGGTEIGLELSRQEIAELVGTTVESAIRVMSRWGREGLIITGERRFVIRDRDRLRAVAEGRAESG